MKDIDPWLTCRVRLDITGMLIEVVEQLFIWIVIVGLVSVTNVGKLVESHNRVTVLEPTSDKLVSVASAVMVFELI